MSDNHINILRMGTGTVFSACLPCFSFSYNRCVGKQARLVFCLVNHSMSEELSLAKSVVDKKGHTPRAARSAKQCGPAAAYPWE